MTTRLQKAQTLGSLPKFFRALLKEGVLIPPSQFEAWFLSTGHTKEDIEEALNRIERAVSSI